MVHYGWRASFWICALIGLLAGVVWFVAARDTPAQHPRVSPSELAAIRSGMTLSAPPESSPAATGDISSTLVSWTRVLRSKEVWAITISYFCYEIGRASCRERV